ncbi:hypothetical protein F4778DRAFT_784623 [Xylariomycetidae sp. FL2044]|nr:hypothetical protein F4778DRAFT_784623 [Xylariomycetidae sp. FL2044]
MPALSRTTILLDTLAGLGGSLLLYSGVSGTFFSPVEWTRYFLGWPQATAETATFFPAATGRNFGAGLFVWIALYLRERLALGVFLVCWAWAGIADTLIVYKHPRGVNYGIHMRYTAIIVVLGGFMIADA